VAGRKGKEREREREEGEEKEVRARPHPPSSSRVDELSLLLDLLDLLLSANGFGFQRPPSKNKCPSTCPS
jgi:hypothetical protein